MDHRVENILIGVYYKNGNTITKQIKINIWKIR